MENFLSTWEGLKYLLETFPPDMEVEDAITKAETDFENGYQK